MVQHRLVLPYSGVTALEMHSVLPRSDVISLQPQLPPQSLTKNAEQEEDEVVEPTMLGMTTIEPVLVEIVSTKATESSKPQSVSVFVGPSISLFVNSDVVDTSPKAILCHAIDISEEIIVWDPVHAPFRSPEHILQSITTLTVEHMVFYSHSLFSEGSSDCCSSNGFIIVIREKGGTEILLAAFLTEGKLATDDSMAFPSLVFAPVYAHYVEDISHDSVFQVILCPRATGFGRIVQHAVLQAHSRNFHPLSLSLGIDLNNFLQVLDKGGTTLQYGSITSSIPSRFSTHLSVCSRMILLWLDFISLMLPRGELRCYKGVLFFILCYDPGGYIPSQWISTVLLRYYIDILYNVYCLSLLVFICSNSGFLHKGGTDRVEYSQQLIQTLAAKYVIVARSFGHIYIPILDAVNFFSWAWFIDAGWLGNVVVLIWWEGTTMLATTLLTDMVGASPWIQFSSLYGANSLKKTNVQDSNFSTVSGFIIDLQGASSVILVWFSIFQEAQFFLFVAVLLIYSPCATVLDALCLNLGIPFDKFTEAASQLVKFQSLLLPSSMFVWDARQLMLFSRWSVWVQLSYFPFVFVWALVPFIFNCVL